MHEAKTHLSRYVAELREGDTLIICNRNRPVAELRALPKRKRTARIIGIDKGLYRLPKSFFDPLPQSMLAAFSGK